MVHASPHGAVKKFRNSSVGVLPGETATLLDRYICNTVGFFQAN